MQSQSEADLRQIELNVFCQKAKEVGYITHLYTPLPCQQTFTEFLY